MQTQSVESFSLTVGALDVSTARTLRPDTAGVCDMVNTLELAPGVPFVIVTAKSRTQGRDVPRDRAGPVPNLRHRITVMQ